MSHPQPSSRRRLTVVGLIASAALALGGLTLPGYAGTDHATSARAAAGKPGKPGKRPGLTCKQIKKRGLDRARGKNGKRCRKPGAATTPPAPPAPGTPAPSPQPTTAPPTSPAPTVGPTVTPSSTPSSTPTGIPTGFPTGTGTPTATLEPTSTATSTPTTTATTTATTTPTAAPTTPTGQTVTDACLSSVPDPDTTTPVEICYTLFKPAGADAAHQVPVIMHSHGWGGSRTTDPADFAQYLDNGYGVLSFDQRGFGGSGGQAYVENPDVEGHDVLALIDLLAKQTWVQLDAPGDPRMGAIGGSYGGGYQFLAAFESMRLGGKPVFDALAPEITWNDLEESLAPSKVVRVAWASALTAASLPSDALPTRVKQDFLLGVAEGQLPDDLVDFFAENGPQFHTQEGRKLDIPVLFGQGTTDSLFPLEQGFQNYQTAITDAARAKSIFIGYNGGHVLPAAYPMGVNVTSDPCSAKLGGTGTNFGQLAKRFFDEQLKGQASTITGYGKYHIATPASACITVDSVAANTDKAIPAITTVAALDGPQVGSLVAAGPITIAGTPSLTAKVTTVVPDSRTFLGLAVGTSASTATLVQNNVLPLREVDMQLTGRVEQIPLPSVAVQVPEGQNLYLIASPSDTIFSGMGSRAAGPVQLTDATVHLPVVTTASLAPRPTPAGRAQLRQDTLMGEAAYRA